MENSSDSDNEELTKDKPWYSLMNRYHWFVLTVAALGWLFDCLDQQLFLLARAPAMADLLKPGQDPNEFGGYATAIFVLGWATGGLIFGSLGDRFGRARTMVITILIYSACTGLSALSQGFADFAFYRFLTGLGVGGEFAVGVALVAEVMPDRVRPQNAPAVREPRQAGGEHCGGGRDEGGGGQARAILSGRLIDAGAMMIWKG
ncbi:MAG: MFS transporter [Pirellulales bacterium]